MIRKGEHTGTAQGCSKPVIHIPVYIENDDFLPTLKTILFSHPVSANKANLKDIPSYIQRNHKYILSCKQILAKRRRFLYSITFGEIQQNTGQGNPFWYINPHLRDSENQKLDEMFR